MVEDKVFQKNNLLRWSKRSFLKIYTNPIKIEVPLKDIPNYRWGQGISKIVRCLGSQGDLSSIFIWNQTLVLQHPYFPYSFKRSKGIQGGSSYPSNMWRWKVNYMQFYLLRCQQTPKRPIDERYRELKNVYTSKIWGLTEISMTYWQRWTIGA